MEYRTYTLGSNYAKATDQSILTDGENINKDLCKGFDSSGLGRGVSASMVDNTGVSFFLCHGQYEVLGISCKAELNNRYAQTHISHRLRQRVCWALQRG